MNANEIIWKDIEEFPKYEISSTALIRNKEAKLIRVTPVGKRGYPVVSLMKDNKVYVRTVHVLFAKAFIPNPSHYPQVNHIDGDKTNCSLSNLEWCSSRENNLHARVTGLHKSNGDKAVLQYDKEENFIAEFVSASQASRLTGIGRSNICNVCNNRIYNGRRTLTAGGYIWKWKK